MNVECFIMMFYAKIIFAFILHTKLQFLNLQGRAQIVTP